MLPTECETSSRLELYEPRFGGSDSLPGRPVVRADTDAVLFVFRLLFSLARPNLS